MIKKALEYIVGMKAPQIWQGDYGDNYTDKELTKIIECDYAATITLTTLSSLAEYIKSRADRMAENMFVHVKSPTCVELFSCLDKYRNREHVAKVVAKLPQITVNQYVEAEMFNSALQSKFVDNADKALLLKFTGTVVEGTVQEYGDDGVTQKATIKTGIASKSDAVVPNPVKLKPYRTFTEVEQPESAFVFRMKSDRGVSCAIFEADGGAWELEAMENIKQYLKTALEGVDGYIIIS